MQYKGQKQRTFLDEALRQRQQRGKQPTYLDAIQAVINFEVFRPLLERPVSRYGPKPYDPVLLWKIVCLQKWFDLSDPGVETAIWDRYSFQAFLGLTLEDDIPDETTICLFRQWLRTNHLYEKLFHLLDEQLTRQGLKTIDGCMVDVTFVAAPKGKRSDGQKTDPNADFGHKGHGYSMPTNVDRTSKLIHRVDLDSARPHDSQLIHLVMTGQETDVWGDSAFAHLAPDFEEMGIQPHFLEKGQRNRPLSEAQKQSNREKSRIRARVEHPYAVLKARHNFRHTRYVGMLANRCDAFCQALAYNLKRAAYLMQNAGQPPRTPLFGG